MSKRGPFVSSNFMCPECNMIIPLPRPCSKQRERGHIKDLYCPTCKKIQKMFEYSEKQLALYMIDSKRIIDTIESFLDDAHYQYLEHKLGISKKEFLKRAQRPNADLDEIYKELISLVQSDWQASDILYILEELFNFDTEGIFDYQEQ